MSGAAEIEAQRRGPRGAVGAGFRRSPWPPSRRRSPVFVGVDGSPLPAPPVRRVPTALAAAIPTWCIPQDS